MVNNGTIVEISVWSIVITISAILTLIMLRKTLNQEVKITKKFFASTTLFFITYTICRIFYFLAWYIDPEEKVFWNIGAILGIMSLIFIIYNSESVIYNKTRYFFTIYGILGLSFMIIFLFLNITYLGLSLTLWAQYITLLVLFTYVEGLFIVFIFKSTDKVKYYFIFMSLAIFLILLGEIFTTDIAHVIFPWTYIGAPLIILMGFILFTLSVLYFYKEPSK